MANTTRWVGGSNGSGLTPVSAGLTLTAFNGLVAGSGVVGTTAIANETGLDQYMAVGGQFVPGATTLAGGFLSLYLLPLNQYAAGVYGDGTVSGSSVPSPSYNVGNFLVNAGILSTGMIYFDFGPIVIPPRAFVLGLYNNLGVTLNAAAAAQVEAYFFDVNLNV